MGIKRIHSLFNRGFKKIKQHIVKKTPLRHPPTHLEDNLHLPVKNLLRIMQERIQQQTTYFGIPTMKNPLDFWVYQEIIFSLKPDVIIEIGNYCGGSTFALAHILDHLDHGKVIGVDINHRRISNRVKHHPRITLVTGDACDSFTKVKQLINPSDTVLIIEDSSHTYRNTLHILRMYSPLVKPDSYFIVEDSICYHGLTTGPYPGPYEAIEQFIKENKHFEVDRSKESFLTTWNPKGFLRRIA